MKKPMIRHCYNCEWCDRYMGHAKCTVKYEPVINGRLEAIFCRYFKMKGGVNDETCKG